MKSWTRLVLVGKSCAWDDGCGRSIGLLLDVAGCAVVSVNIRIQIKPPRQPLKDILALGELLRPMSLVGLISAAFDLVLFD